ncbi:unnamed protein product [Amoebophrya sp. A120]|nr:unnamed protein product [Amoebophrya sp. A120]|eukprot:GSA120T00011413001.1
MKNCTIPRFVRGVRKARTYMRRSPRGFMTSPAVSGLPSCGTASSPTRATTTTRTPNSGPGAPGGSSKVPTPTGAGARVRAAWTPRTCITCTNGNPTRSTTP